ncbi:hypothetical protein TSAR_011494 [Trichomalopsis sarcophagae]|uniref:CHK kinase-like domain-containing protein n=1 Tax=Trichomalopsis sarcophagae TaxID=543379 RepID=A0A232EWZ1_9HYME|nr:hypothetical protein TSAR_011494 [Trichomalopsis sarcophagae]
MATCNNNQYLDREEVAIIIKEAFGTATKFVKYYSTNLSDKKVGFMGSLQTLVVVVEENDCEQKTYSFFFKSIPYEIENQLSWILESKIFTKETNFFKFIVPELMASINDKSWIARCYFIKDDLMVFEDLKIKKFEISTKILDEPCVRYVPPMFEIAQFMHITTGREFRKQRETEMLKHYHDVLCKTLKDNSDRQAPVPSFSDILDQYEEMKIVGIISAALYNPTILVNEDVMTEKVKSSDGYAEFMFSSDRVKFMLEYMEKDTIFKDRLVECITELIERSNILLENK